MSLIELGSVSVGELGRWELVEKGRIRAFGAFSRGGSIDKNRKERLLAEASTVQYTT